MVIRFRVPFDNGTIRCAAGETTGALPNSVAARMVRSGLADEVPGNRGVNLARAASGLPAIKARARPRKK